MLRTHLVTALLLLLYSIPSHAQSDRAFKQGDFVLLRRGTPIHTTAEAASSSPPLEPMLLSSAFPPNGSEAETTRVWVARVYADAPADADTLHIETLDSNERLEHCHRNAPGGHNVARVHGFVHRSALQAMTPEVTRVDYDDGSWAELGAGVLLAQPELPGQSGWVAEIYGVSIPVAESPTTYAYDALPTHFEVNNRYWGDHFSGPPDLISDTMLFFLNGRAWARGYHIPLSMRVIEHVDTTPSGQTRVEVGDVCLRLGMLAEFDNIYGEIPGVGGIGGFGRNTPVDTYTVPKDAELLWADGSGSAGVMLRSLTITYQPGTTAEGLRCLQLDIATASQLCVTPDALQEVAP